MRFAPGFPFYAYLHLKTRHGRLAERVDVIGETEHCYRVTPAGMRSIRLPGWRRWLTAGARPWFDWSADHATMIGRVHTDSSSAD